MFKITGIIFLAIALSGCVKKPVDNIWRDHEGHKIFFRGIYGAYD